MGDGQTVGKWKASSTPKHSSWGVKGLVAVGTLALLWGAGLPRGWPGDEGLIVASMCLCLSLFNSLTASRRRVRPWRGVVALLPLAVPFCLFPQPAVFLLSSIWCLWYMLMAPSRPTPGVESLSEMKRVFLEPSETNASVGFSWPFQGVPTLVVICFGLVSALGLPVPSFGGAFGLALLFGGLFQVPQRHNFTGSP